MEQQLVNENNLQTPQYHIKKNIRYLLKKKQNVIVIYAKDL